jgi:DNA repair photolyase
VCAEFRNPVAVITKSALVRRDADVLRHLADTAGVRVLISIAFRDDAVARQLDPGAPGPKRRFETMRLLADAGVPVGVIMAPVIPGLNEQDIPGILEESRRNGAAFASHALLRLPGSVKDVFLHRMREAMPLRADRVERRIREARGGALNDSRFGSRFAGQGQHWRAIEEMWTLWTRRLGFADGETPIPSRGPSPPRAPERRSPGTQLELSL